MSLEHLNPCRRCGGKGHKQFYVNSDQGHNSAAVQCSCGEEGPPALRTEDDRSIKDLETRARRRWNFSNPPLPVGQVT